MSDLYEHDLILFGARSGLVPFVPLTAPEFKTMNQSQILSTVDDETLDRMWLRPAQRRVQELYQIDQRAYSAGSTPTLAELTEDFKVAVAMFVNKIAGMLPHDQLGASAQDKSSGIIDEAIPSLAATLLARYRRRGGGVVRA